MSNNPIPGRPEITRHYFPRIPRLSDKYILGLYAKVDASMDRVWGEKHERNTYKFLGIYSCDTEEIKPFPATKDWEEGLDPKTVWWYPNRWPVNPDFFAKVLMWLFLNIWLGIILRPMFWYKPICRVTREWCISFYMGMYEFFSKISMQNEPAVQRSYPSLGFRVKARGYINMFEIFNVSEKFISILKYIIIAAAIVFAVNHIYDSYRAEKALKEQSAIATLQKANQELREALEQQKKEDLLREIESRFDKVIAEQEQKETEESIKSQLQRDEERMAAIRTELKDIQSNSDLGTVLGVSDKPVDYSLSKETKTGTLKSTYGIKLDTKAQTNETTKTAKATTQKTTVTKSNTTKTTKTAAELKREKEIAVSQVQIEYLWEVYNQAIAT